jgi:hypothetical protein
MLKIMRYCIELEHVHLKLDTLPMRQMNEYIS